MADDTLHEGKFEEPPKDKDKFIQLWHLDLKNVLMLTFICYLKEPNGFDIKWDKFIIWNLEVYLIRVMIDIVSF